MVFRYLISLFALFSILFASDDLSLAIDCDIVDLNKSKNFLDINKDREFYYHITLTNNLKKPSKDIKLYANIPDDIDIDKIGLEKQNCSYKSHYLSCVRRSLKDKKIDFYIKAKRVKKLLGNLTTTFFLEANSKLVASDTVLINIDDVKKFNNQKANRDLSVFISKDNPKVKDKIYLEINSSKDIDLILQLDKRVKYISSNICKKSSNNLECRFKKSDSAKIELEAVDYGLSINEIVDKSSKKILKDILFDIKRDYIPDLNYSIKTRSDELISSTKYRYMIDINSSKLKRDIKDLEFTLLTLSKDNFKFLRSSSDRWACKQRGKFLRCKRDELKKGDNGSFYIEVLAPDYSTSIKTRATLTPNSEDRPKDSELDIVHMDFDMDNTKEFALEDEFKGDLRVYKEFGTFFDKRDVDLGYSKLYIKKRDSSDLNLSLDSEDEIIYAKLIWMARVDKNIDYDKLKYANSVKFRSKKDSNFNKIFSQLSNFNYKSDGDFLYYEAYADVTNYIKKYKSGEYELKDLICSSGFGAYGRWSLVVVSKNKKQKSYKDLKLYYGFEGLYKSDSFSDGRYFLDDINIDLELQKDLDSKISLYIFGGDNEYEDSVILRDTAGSTLYSKKNIATNLTNVDINIGESEKSISNLELYSKGDKFFVGFISTIQEQKR